MQRGDLRDPHSGSALACALFSVFLFALVLAVTVVIDRATAGKEDFEVGDIVGVQSEGPIQHLRVAGIVKFGSVATIGGATITATTSAKIPMQMIVANQ